MPHKLLLATRNKGKIEEFRRILDAVAPGEIDLVGLDGNANSKNPALTAPDRIALKADVDRAKTRLTPLWHPPARRGMR